MAKKRSGGSQSIGKSDDTAAGAAADTGAPIVGDTTLTARLFDDDANSGTAHADAASTPDTPRDPEPEAEAAAPSAAPSAAAAPVETALDSATGANTPPPSPQNTTVIEKRGPGILALLIGGVVAAALGFGAAYTGMLSRGDPDQNDQIAAAIENQSSALASLQDQVGALPAQAPEVDLSPVMTQLSALSERLEGTSATIDTLSDRLEGTSTTIETLSDRVGALEARPALTGQVDEDTAAMAEAMTRLEAELGTRQAENAALAEEVRARAEEAQAVMAEAEERARAAMAEAEQRAQASVAAASAQSALSRVRVAMATGDPFETALAEINAGDAVPEDLAAAAASGVPTLEELQAGFPAAARAALPVALREQSAEGTAGDRAVAFLRGQFAGRAVAPREGDDPDAVLSRAQAAVTAGDLDTALAELETLPAPALAEIDDWVTAARRRATADDALDTLAATLDGSN